MSRDAYERCRDDDADDTRQNDDERVYERQLLSDTPSERRTMVSSADTQPGRAAIRHDGASRAAERGCRRERDSARAR